MKHSRFLATIAVMVVASLASARVTEPEMKKGLLRIYLQDYLRGKSTNGNPAALAKIKLGNLQVVAGKAAFISGCSLISRVRLETYTARCWGGYSRLIAQNNDPTQAPQKLQVDDQIVLESPNYALHRDNVRVIFDVIFSPQKDSREDAYTFEIINTLIFEQLDVSGANFVVFDND